MMRLGMLRFAAITAAALAAAAPAARAEVKPIVWTFTPKSKLTFYGQVDLGILSYDDGRDTDVYAPVDNSNSTSRLGYWIQSDLNGGWTFRGNLEVEYTPSPSKTVNQKTDVTNWDFNKNNVRKAEVTFGNKTYGAIWLGQGSMATDSISEIDISGTSVAAYSAVSDIAGGNFYRLAGAELSNINVGSTFSNFDGNRRFRARYDTPTFLDGFMASIAYGQEQIKDNDDNDYYDAALRYNGKFAGFQAQAGVGYSDLGNDTTIWSGSASVIHVKTGISATVALGEQDKNGATSNSGYLKLGLLRSFFALGKTGLSIDYQKSDEVKAQNSSADSVGLAVVQNFDKQNLEVYAVVRQYNYDAPGTSYDDGLALFTGVRFKF